MKKIIKNIMAGAMAVAVCAVAVIMVSAKPDGTITKEGKTTIVNTKDIATDVKGFKGQTPVKIYIKKGKIVKVEALRNQETPQYLARAKKVLDKYQGVKVEKAATMKVDGVTGATFTSKALVRNVQRGANYYQKNKK